MVGHFSQVTSLDGGREKMGIFLCFDAVPAMDLLEVLLSLGDVMVGRSLAFEHDAGKHTRRFLDLGVTLDIAETLLPGVIAWSTLFAPISTLFNGDLADW